MWYFYVEGSTTIPSSYTFRVGQVPLDKLPSLAGIAEDFFVRLSNSRPWFVFQISVCFSLKE